MSRFLCGFLVVIGLSVSAIAKADYKRGCFDEKASSELRIESCTAILAKPDNPPSIDTYAYGSRAQGYMEVEKYEEAYEDISRVINDLADGKCKAEALATRGALVLYLLPWREPFGREKSVEDLEAALTLDPENAKILEILSGAYSLSRNHEKAFQVAMRALSIDPTLEGARMRRAGKYEDRGQYEEALEDWNYLISHHPTKSLYFSSRARVFERMGNIDAALSDYRRSLELKPSRPWLIKRIKRLSSQK